MTSGGKKAEDSPARSQKPHTGVIRLLNDVRSGAVRPGELGLHERRACVAYLRLEGYTQEEVAEVLHVSRQTVVRDEQVNRKDAARLVDDLGVRVIAGDLIRLARHLTAKTLKKKDHALAWRIARELVSDLQGLGYLPKAPEQHNVSIATFADLAKLALEGPEAAHAREPGGGRALPAPKGAGKPGRKRASRR